MSMEWWNFQGQLPPILWDIDHYCGCCHSFLLLNLLRFSLACDCRSFRPDNADKFDPQWHLEVVTGYAGASRIISWVMPGVSQLRPRHGQHISPQNHWNFNWNKVMFGVLFPEQGCLAQFLTGLSFWILKLPPEDLDGIGWGEMGRFQQNYSPGRSPECHRRTRTDPRLWKALTESSSFLRWTSTYKCTKGWGSIPWPHRHKKCLTLGNA